MTAISIAVAVLAATLVIFLIVSAAKFFGKKLTTEIMIPFYKGEDGIIRIGRFTKDAWNDLGYPGTYYGFINRPDDDFAYIQSVKLYLDPIGPDADQFMIVTIDEEFGYWLKNVPNVPKDPENLNRYLQSISLEDAERLMKKDRIQMGYASYVLTVGIIYHEDAPERAGFSIEKDMRDKLRAVIDRLGYGRSWVARYLIDKAGLNGHLEEFRSEADAFLSSGVEVICSKWEEIRRKGSSFEKRYIPIFIDRHVDSALTKIEQGQLPDPVDIAAQIDRDPLFTEAMNGIRDRFIETYGGKATIQSVSLVQIKEDPGDIKIEQVTYGVVDTRTGERKKLDKDVLTEGKEMPS